MSLKDKLLSKTARRHCEVAIDGEVYRVQSLTEKERTEYELSLQDKKTGKISFEKSRRMLLVKTLVDEEGKRLFEDAEIDALQEVDGRITGALFDAAQKHCGYDRDEIEALTKN